MFQQNTAFTSFSSRGDQVEVFAQDFSSGLDTPTELLAHALATNDWWTARSLISRIQADEDLRDQFDPVLLQAAEQALQHGAASLQ
ncbi:MAG: hypothetical protein KIH65_001165 [Candidatus Uhrbacteria bacterium]|nr:hypothetical protein [Candidatus Uhrbacteria bacterium]